MPLFLRKRKNLLLITLLFISQPVFALNFAVDNTGGFCVDHSASGGNFATLAAAMAAANTAGFPHTIDICPSATAYTAQGGALANANYAGLTIQGTTGTAADVTVNPTGNNEGFDIRQPNVTIQHLSVDNGSNTNDGIEIRGNNVSILNVDIQNTGRNGILVITSTGVTISNVTIATTVREGIFANAGSTGLVINSADGTKPLTSISTTTLECIEIDAPGVDINDVTVSNCNNIGLRVDGANATLDNITVNTTNNEGILLTQAAPLLNQDNVINTISITNTGREGLRTGGNADNAVISNITVNTTTGGGRECMQLAGDNTVVTNIDLDICAGDGLRFDGTFNSITTADINTTGVYGVRVSGNDGTLNGVDVFNANNTGIRIENQRADLDNITISDTRIHGIQITQHDADINNATLTNIGTYLAGNAGADGITVNQRRLNLTNITINDARDFGIHYNNSGNNTSSAVNFNNITIDNTGDDGMFINRTTNNFVANNISVTNSADRGITLNRSRRVTLSRLYITNNTTDGIFFNSTRQSDLSLSEISNNGLRGIVINGSATNGNSDSNDIFDNIIENNGNRGIVINNNGAALNTNNTIYNNCFTNPAAAFNAQNNEPGGTNSFDNGSRGNFWGSDVPNPTGYSESCTDSDGDEICDTPFLIPGSGGSSDLYPLTLCEVGQIAEWHFDENGWTGAAGEVIDSSVNGLNATAVPAGVNVPLNIGSNPAIPGTPGTCFYGVFDAADDYIELPGSFPDFDDSFTVTAWIQSNNVATGGQRIFADDESNTQGYAFSLGDDASGRLRFFSRGVTPIIVDTQNAVITNGQWHHVAMVHDGNNKTRQIYVDGVAVVLDTGSTVATYTGTWGTDAGTASIGGETAASAESALKFDGLIDEVRVYEYALRTTDVARIMNTTRPCAGFSHYAISYPNGNTGLTCEDSIVRIAGHDFADNETNVPAGTVLTLNVSGSAIWQAAPVVGGGVWSGGGSASETYTWPASESFFAVPLQDTTAETVNIDLVDNAGRTENTGSTFEDPSLTFQAQGFRITTDGSSSTSIATHIAGKDSDVNFGAQTLYIQGARTTGPSCNTNIGGGFGGVENIEIAVECNNPSTCSAEQVTIEDSSATATPITMNDAGAALSYTSINLDFSNNPFAGTSDAAPLIFNYPDAGSLTIHMRSVPDSLSGSSNAFVVRPFGFRIDNFSPANPAATDATGGVFTEAGASFTSDISAVVWQAADDDGSTGGTANDGIPDSNTTLSDNAVTPNFGNESTTVVASLSHTLVAPTGGQTGVLTGTGNFSGFSSGVVSGKSMSWDEVGIIQLDITESNNDYLNGGQDIVGQVPYLGRFTPDRLQVTAQNSPSFANTCTTGGFTYLDESFYFATAPRLRIRGLNASGAVTRNYDSGQGGVDDFWKLTTVPAGELLERTYADQSGAAASFGVVLDVEADISFNNQNNFNGRVDLILNSGTNGDVFAYSRVSEEAEFTSLVDLTFTAAGLTDEDGVCYDPDDNGSCDDFTEWTTGGTGGAITGTDLRFGRLNIGTAGGSELIPVSPLFQTEYFDGTSFIVNTADSCTSIAMTDLTLNNVLDPLQTDGDIDISDTAFCGGTGIATGTMGNVPFSTGLGGLSFSIASPAAGCTGYLEMAIDLSTATGLDMPWLQYDWDDLDELDDGPYDGDPKGRVDFGIFDGPEEFIYIREPW